MKIIGITGSIASGKSTVAKWVKNLGISVYDADLVVHELLAPGGEAVAEVLDVFGAHLGSLERGINRKLLGDEVFVEPQKRSRLESILHPMVCKYRNGFIDQQRNTAASAVGLDIPLLFETNGEKFCDYVIVVHASATTTESRALSRSGMTQQKLSCILASQIPTADKLHWADLALDTDLSKEETYDHLINWLSRIGLSMFLTGK